MTRNELMDKMAEMIESYESLHKALIDELEMADNNPWKSEMILAQIKELSESKQSLKKFKYLFDVEGK